MIPDQQALLDTSVFIALESARPVVTDALPVESAASVVTLAELQAGVLSAGTAQVRSRRLKTLQQLGGIEVLVIDEEVAAEWARLRVQAALQRRRVKVNDLWIAATAAAHDLPVVTRDADFDLFPGSGVRIIQV